MIERKEYFSEKEIRCPCCGHIEYNELHYGRMYALRVMTGRPLIVTSWCRCPKHNKEIGSHTENHIHGAATDILVCGGPFRLRFLDAVLRVGFERIGIHRNFIHLDSTNNPKTIWLYHDVS